MQVRCSFSYWFPIYNSCEDNKVAVCTKWIWGGFRGMHSYWFSFSNRWNVGSGHCSWDKTISPIQEMESPSCFVGCQLWLEGKWGRGGGGLSKRKNAMTRAPFLFLSVIQCLPHSLPLPRLKQSIILGSVNSTASCDNICSILVWPAHKTRPKTYAKNASLSPQQQPPLILQVLCVPFPLVTFACT